MIFQRKNVTQRIVAIALITFGTIGLSAGSIFSPIVTPAAHAFKWVDSLPVPTGIFVDLGFNKYYYGNLNDPSQIVGGVKWQINGANGVLLKGYGTAPRFVFDLINKLFFQPVRVE
jgi:hypothetical protein